MPELAMDIAWPELAAVVLSRELRDGEVGSPGGARSEIPLAAARLAQLTHAPNLAVVTSAVGYVTNAIGKPWGPLCQSTTDYRNIHAGAEAVLPLLSVFRTKRDWFFAGGAVRIVVGGSVGERNDFVDAGDDRTTTALCRFGNQLVAEWVTGIGEISVDVAGGGVKKCEVGPNSANRDDRFAGDRVVHDLEVRIERRNVSADACLDQAGRKILGRGLEACQQLRLVAFPDADAARSRGAAKAWRETEMVETHVRRPHLGDAAAGDQKVDIE